MELPPSISVTHVGFRDGWLPGGSSTTPVDFRALYAPGTKQDNTNTVNFSKEKKKKNIVGLKSTELLFYGKEGPCIITQEMSCRPIIDNIGH